MKQLLILLFLATSIVGFSQSNDEIAVRKLLNDQQVSWNRGDIDGFMKGYWKGDSLTFTGKSGITLWAGRKLWLIIKETIPDTVAMGKLEFTVIT